MNCTNFDLYFRFRPERFATLNGLGIFIAGIIGLLEYPIYAITKRYLGSDPFWVSCTTVLPTPSSPSMHFIIICLPLSIVETHLYTSKRAHNFERLDASQNSLHSDVALLGYAEEHVIFVRSLVSNEEHLICIFDCVLRMMLLFLAYCSVLCP